VVGKATAASLLPLFYCYNDSSSSSPARRSKRSTEAVSGVGGALGNDSSSYNRRVEHDRVNPLEQCWVN